MANRFWCEQCARELKGCEVAFCELEDETGIWTEELCLRCVSALWFSEDFASIEVYRPLPNGWNPAEFPEVDGRRWVA